MEDLCKSIEKHNIDLSKLKIKNFKKVQPDLNNNYYLEIDVRQAHMKIISYLNFLFNKNYLDTYDDIVTETFKNTKQTEFIKLFPKIKDYREMIFSKSSKIVKINNEKLEKIAHKYFKFIINQIMIIINDNYSSDVKLIDYFCDQVTYQIINKDITDKIKQTLDQNLSKPITTDWLKIHFFRKITFNNHKFYVKEYINNQCEFKFVSKDEFEIACELYSKYIDNKSIKI